MYVCMYVCPEERKMGKKDILPPKLVKTKHKRKEKERKGKERKEKKRKEKKRKEKKKKTTKKNKKTHTQTKTSGSTLHPKSDTDFYIHLSPLCQLIIMEPK